MKESIGFGGMNVYIRKFKRPLATGYYHNDNQVGVILTNLRLENGPKLYMPEVQFSLTSNVLKLQSMLSRMVVHAEYSLIRNKSDIVFETDGQDSSNTSPFLFQQVRDSGKIAITMDECLLTGYVMTTLNGESVDLGYPHFRIIKCQYTIEIYREGSGSPPVIAKYTFANEGQGLSLNLLLLKPIDDELIPKLQAGMFSFCNTSSMFNRLLGGFVDRQEKVFHATSSYMMGVVRQLNKISAEERAGTLNIPDYNIVWDDGMEHADALNETIYQNVRIKDVLITGIDTLYAANIGGPFKMNSIIIGEEIRFSTLQLVHISPCPNVVEVQEEFEWQKRDAGEISDKHPMLNRSPHHQPTTGTLLGTDPFPNRKAEIKDVAVDIQLDVKPEQAVVQGRRSPQILRERATILLRNLEVVGFRDLSLTVPAVVFSSAESLLTGYLTKELPRVISVYLKALLPQVLVTIKKVNKETEEPPPPVVNSSSNDKNGDNLTENEILKPKFRGWPHWPGAVLLPDFPKWDFLKSVEDDEETENFTQLPLKHQFAKNKKRFQGMGG
ncbi:unnamed protein product [Chrysodeixis includens]|uniref:Uncharacterized protein n=1 Tax=Chrysodeixis includens TaxID=689277 RepID=A0A9N8KVR3_CHRIL|nr:unnamed protein product [Chrysodeixis includens]